MDNGFHLHIHLHLHQPTMASLLRLSSPTHHCHHHHKRSTSLPTLSHPLISNLSLSLNSLRHCCSTSSPLTSTFTTTLSHLHHLLSSLSNLLLLPNTRHLLLRNRSFLSSLLDHTLLLVDAYGSFREHLISIHQLLSQSQVSIRRKDTQSLSIITRSRRRVEKDLLRLASTMASNGRSINCGEEELMDLLMEAKATIFTTSAALFGGLVGFSRERSYGFSMVSSSSTWDVLMMGRRRKQVGKEVKLEKKMEELRRVEKCVVDVESGSEKVFQELVRTRVMLLNILTP